MKFCRRELASVEILRINVGLRKSVVMISKTERKLKDYPVKRASCAHDYWQGIILFPWCTQIGRDQGDKSAWRWKRPLLFGPWSLNAGLPACGLGDRFHCQVVLAALATGVIAFHPSLLDHHREAIISRAGYLYNARRSEAHKIRMNTKKVDICKIFYVEGFKLG